MGSNGSYNGEIGGDDADDLELNSRALEVVNELIEGADWMQIGVHEIAGATVLDCGIDAYGGIAAGHLIELDQPATSHPPSTLHPPSNRPATLRSAS